MTPEQVLKLMVVAGWSGKLTAPASPSETSFAPSEISVPLEMEEIMRFVRLIEETKGF